MRTIRQNTLRGVRVAAILAASTLSVSVWAAQWQPVTVSNKGSLFIDVQSIERHGDRMSGRVMRHAIQPRFAGGDGDAHESEVLLVDIDCAAGTVGSVPANSADKQFSGSPNPKSYTNAAPSLDPVKTLACDPVALTARLPK